MMFMFMLRQSETTGACVRMSLSIKDARDFLAKWANGWFFFCFRASHCLLATDMKLSSLIYKSIFSSTFLTVDGRQKG